MTRLIVVVASLASAAAIGGGLAGSATSASPTASRSADAAAVAGRGGIDPRAGGFVIGLGEWALAPEAKAIRPGRVTFVVRNQGKFRHGLELEISRRDRHEDDDRDHDDAKSIRLEAGQATKMTLDLEPGMYDIRCFVSHHDELGMRAVLEVRADAPLLAPETAKAARSTVDIAGFAFKPATLRTTAGTLVTWRNSDAAPHTATGKPFSSPQLGRGATFRFRFGRAGTYSYLCAVHPAMRGKVVVARRGSG